MARNDDIFVYCCAAIAVILFVVDLILFSNIAATVFFTQYNVLSEPMIYTVYDSES